MRVKNKEIRARQHRKEQKQKDAAREIRAKYGEPKPTGGAQSAVKKPAAAKAAPKKTAEAAPKAAAPKKAAATKGKKAEPKAE
jgi:hypothetical protein